MEIKPSKFIFLFGLFSLMISLILIYVVFFVLEDYDDGGLLSVILMFIGFFSIGLYLTLHYYKYRIVIKDRSMIINNEIGSKKEIFWFDIEKISYNKFFKMIVIFRGSKKTWISPIYAHFIDFIPEDKYSDELKSFLGKTNS